ncbi:MAG: pyridoxine 5'-phosphate synthase [Planctomycetes bacterium]|nr:pyridoxine 5'-phosphate synthase [Planctomycetota bacterium]
MPPVRLHVNVDHIATVRQARREAFPDPVSWALACEAAGADGITCHLRFDRRHIQDEDVRRLREAVTTPLNLELALTPEMVEIALESGAELFCLVPESREELTTEGGLNVHAELERVREVSAALSARGGIVSAFVDPEESALEASAEAGCAYVELHTGTYANAGPEEVEQELERLHEACERAHALGLGVNAGHGLTLENVGHIARLPHIQELNIGYAIVARALTVGVEAAVREMKDAIEEAVS